jgi:Raf kinase inhibitor-like YbhB/YbcL family protein
MFVFSFLPFSLQAAFSAACQVVNGGSDMAFSITTSAFNNGELIPKQFTCDGADAAPLLTVTDPPGGTRSYALIVDDPDAPKGVFTHWLAYDIPGVDGELRVTEGKTLRNGFGRSGYGGPCPPPGHGIHRYFFTVHAVDVPSLELKGDSRRDLENALQSHTLASAQVMGKYERKSEK